MTDTQELLRRLEGGEVGREIDAEIGWLIGGWRDEVIVPSADVLAKAIVNAGLNVPYYSTSLDAAIALVERARPGWRWLIEYDDHRGPSYGAQIKEHGEDWSITKRCLAATPAAALIAALLRAEG